uniref:HDC12875 n=1 Tax=Drosophila melanogaster TaxID=7227 RepID=Q6IKC5_DROME|nr:TPA_inf: HDC12875 [Drosophila melanogaster]
MCSQVIVRRARCRLTCAAMDDRLAPTKIKLMEWSAVEWFEPLEWQQAGSEIPGCQDLLAQKAKSQAAQFGGNYIWHIAGLALLPEAERSVVVSFAYFDDKKSNSRFTTILFE